MISVDERREIVEDVRRFAQEVVAPVAADLDHELDPADSFSWDIVERGNAIGLRTLGLEADAGGVGADALTIAMVIEELAKVDLGVSVIFAQTLKISQTLSKAASEDQRQRFLPPYVDDPRALLAIAITEPDRASDYIIPFDDATASFATSARRVDGGWVLNGEKHFISNGNRASLYLVFARTEPGVSLVEGSTCFLVPRDTAGFSTGRVHDKMGERLVNNAVLNFDDCFVPEADVLGEVGEGFQVLARFFPASNAYAAASAIGVAEHAYERALSWTRQRVQGGKPLIDHDLIAADLARMWMQIEAARSYIYRAAEAAEDPAQRWDPTMGALPKVFASEAAWEVVTTALELHGGYGYMRDLGFDKLVRDAAAFLHSDGANRTLLLKAARFIRS